MDAQAALLGVDAHLWRQDGFPDIRHVLRDIASSDPEVSDHAIHKLYDQVLNQESLMPLTVPTIPYIARLAAAGVRSSALLYLLGRIAAAEDGAARVDVARELSLVVPLLAHEDSEVRQLAVWAVAQCRDADGVRDAIEARWSVEDVPAVRADLLFALSRVAPVASRNLLAECVRSSRSGRVRLAAIAAGLWAGVPWDESMARVLVSLLPAEEQLGDSPWLKEPLIDIVQRVAASAGSAAAVALIDEALRATGRRERASREELLLAARVLGDRNPEAREPLLPGLLLIAEDPELARRVVRRIKAWRETPGFLDVLRALAERGGHVSGIAREMLEQLLPDGAASPK